MRSRNTIRRCLTVAIFFTTALLMAPGGDTAAADCQADLNAILMTTSELDYIVVYNWKVDITSRERCAKVDFELLAYESPRGEDDRIRRVPFREKIRDGVTKSRKVRHQVEKGTKLARWEFKVVKCTPCGALD